MSDSGEPRSQEAEASSPPSEHPNPDATQPESGPVSGALPTKSAIDGHAGAVPPPSPPQPVPPSTEARTAKQFGALYTDGALPSEFAAAVLDLQSKLKLPVWLLMLPASPRPPFRMLDGQVSKLLIQAKQALAKGQPIALVIDSPGGLGVEAFRIASSLRRHCGGFTAVVPRSAKSAATLLALGASEILMAPDAELGPLDAQYVDMEREQPLSALDEVHSLDRLNAAALDAIDETTLFLVMRSGKKVATILPVVMRYVSDLMRPLMENLDVVHYTNVSRTLKVAEEYAIRLLTPIHGSPKAEEIAAHLVEHYPEHGFAIYPEEARDIGLQVSAPRGDLVDTLETIARFGGTTVALGPIIELEKAEDEDDAGDSTEGHDSDGGKH